MMVGGTECQGTSLTEFRADKHGGWPLQQFTVQEKMISWGFVRMRK